MTWQPTSTAPQGEECELMFRALDGVEFKANGTYILEGEYWHRTDGRAVMEQWPSAWRPVSEAAPVWPVAALVILLLICVLAYFHTEGWATILIWVGAVNIALWVVSWNMRGRR